MTTREKSTALIMCTGNSCRSHLAEGLLRSVAGDSIQVESAGSVLAGYVHSLAIRVFNANADGLRDGRISGVRRHQEIS